VDDDPDFRQLYRTVLRLEGFDVHTASDGIEALHLIEGSAPSLVILDLNMPCLDGGSVLRELEARPETKDTPVLIVTGSEPDRVEHAAAVVRKPVTPEQLLPIIERELKAA
jgi:two-component system chemotaxis response regulator CheY